MPPPLALAQEGPCDGPTAALAQHDRHAAVAAAVAGPDMTTKGSSSHLHRISPIPAVIASLSLWISTDARLVLHVQITRELDG